MWYSVPVPVTRGFETLFTIQVCDETLLPGRAKLNESPSACAPLWERSVAFAAEPRTQLSLLVHLGLLIGKHTKPRCTYSM